MYVHREERFKKKWVEIIYDGLDVMAGEAKGH
jgi:hypothetical protein